MDPKVCGKLLTHHRKGSKVDVEPLRDRFPIRQIAGEGLQMGLSLEQKLAVVEKVFCGLPYGFLIFYEFIVVKLGQTELGGTREAPGRARRRQACPG